jgi:circadian clock protein KaiC
VTRKPGQKAPRLPSPSDRIHTGITGLDDVLHGGLIRGNSILVEGKAGVGKSILGLQFLVAGAVQHGERGLLLSFDVEPNKLYRDAMNLGWDLKQLESEGKLRIIMASAQAALDQLQKERSPLDRVLKEMNPSRLVIDSVTLLRDLIPDRAILRKMVKVLLNSAAREGLTMMLIAELIGQDSSEGGIVERSAVDAIISLSAELYEGREYELRRLRVVKARGQSFVTGNHTYRIRDRRGIELYPRVASAPEAAFPRQLSSKRDSFGIPALDKMLGGGTYPGTATLVAGSTGTGKSLLGLQYILAGIQAGQRALIINMEETPEQIVRNAKVLNLDLAPLVDSGMLRLMYADPAEVDLNQHLGVVMEDVRTRGIRRILIDSVTNYAVIAPSESQFKDSLFTLVSYLKTAGVSSLFTSETAELMAATRVTEQTVSVFVDAIMLLQYVQTGQMLSRQLLVLKTRGSDHAKDFRTYTIGPGGFHLDKPAAAGKGAPQISLPKR